MIIRSTLVYPKIKLLMMNEASLVLQYRPPSPPRFYESTSCNGHGLLKYNA